MGRGSGIWAWTRISSLLDDGDPDALASEEEWAEEVCLMEDEIVA